MKCRHTYTYLNQRAASPCMATRPSSTVSGLNDASVIWDFTNASQQKFPYAIPSKPVVALPIPYIYRSCPGSNSTIPMYLMIDVATPYPQTSLNAMPTDLPTIIFQQADTHWWQRDSFYHFCWNKKRSKDKTKTVGFQFVREPWLLQHGTLCSDIKWHAVLNGSNVARTANWFQVHATRYIIQATRKVPKEKQKHHMSQTSDTGQRNIFRTINITFLCIFEKLSFDPIHPFPISSLISHFIIASH